MTLPFPLRRVPWTCRWGRFGGPVEKPGVRGFVFWICGHPDSARHLLDRNSCEECPRWEPADEFAREADRRPV